LSKKVSNSSSSILLLLLLPPKPNETGKVVIDLVTLLGRTKLD
jgi:hypothetical protein